MLIVHFIVGLNNGGAEHMLYNILRYKYDISINYIVISLKKNGYYKKKIQELNIKVIEFDTSNIYKSSIEIINTIKKCDELNCWMYHCNFIGFIIGRFLQVKRITWCIRHCDFSPRNNKIGTLIIIKICALISHFVDSISYNGELCKKLHEKLGYSKKNGIVINNGSDIDIYNRIDNAKKLLAEELLLPDLTYKKCILSVARYHPLKDITTFIKVITKLKAEYDITVLMCGKNINIGNRELVTLINDSGLCINKEIFLLGERSDLPKIFSAADLYILHSLSEAFPNTLIEAMACGTPCIATDVGNVNDILTKRFISPVKDVQSLINHAIEILQLPLSDIREIQYSNRQLVITKYNIREVVKSYEKYFKGH